MPAIAALLESRAALTSLRRSLPKGGPRVVTCRSADALCTGCWRRGWWTRWSWHRSPLLLPELAQLRARFLSYPAGRLRARSVLMTASCCWPAANAVAAVAVEGVDDPIVGELVVRRSITAERRRALADAPGCSG